MKDFNFDQFRTDFDNAMKALQDKYDVTIDLGNIGYSNTEFSSKITVKPRTIDGKGIEQVEFEKACKLYGFEPDHYLAHFELQGKAFELYGFNHRARKSPMQIRELATGKCYKTSEETVKRKLGIEA